MWALYEQITDQSAYIMYSTEGLFLKRYCAEMKERSGEQGWLWGLSHNKSLQTAFSTVLETMSVIMATFLINALRKNYANFC